MYTFISGAGKTNKSGFGGSKKDKDASKGGKERGGTFDNYKAKAVEVTLNFNYDNLEFQSTRELALIQPNEREREQLSDLLTDIE